MADEVIAEIPNEDKQSNKTFTQSDYDKMVAKKEKEISDKFKDYETLKSKAETLEKIQSEQEASKLSEIEKATKRANELEAKILQIEAEKNVLAKRTLKLGVLSDQKFIGLPEPYKAIVDGEDAESLKASAEKALEDFNEVLKKNGLKAGTSGMPLDIKQPTPVKLEDPIVLALKKRFGGN